ncbi:hypothetical protein BGZ94_008218 [Podila epigama]|nr:hypothetical protein BGZ94_008218 [Podila epigama]
MDSPKPSRINITITPSTQPSTIDTANSLPPVGADTPRCQYECTNESSSSSSSFDDSYNYTRRKKNGRHVQGLPASTIATVDAVLDRTYSAQGDTHRFNMDGDNVESDSHEDTLRGRHGHGDWVNNANKAQDGGVTQTHDLGHSSHIAPVQPHRQVKHSVASRSKPKQPHQKPLNKNQQSRHVSRSRSKQRLEQQQQQQSNWTHIMPEKTEISSSEDSIEIKDARYPSSERYHGHRLDSTQNKESSSDTLSSLAPKSKGDPPIDSSLEASRPRPRPLSQEQIQMFRTSTSPIGGEDLAYGQAFRQYDDEKQQDFSPNWPLFLPDEQTERRIVRKLDWNLLPLLGILYLFSYLDRVNIGNARLFGLEESVHLTDNQYNIALGVFFLAYAIFEIPSNWILLRVGPKVWIPFLMLSWGTVSLALAWVTSFTGLVIARFALGVAEAGFVPGVLYYITLFYKRSEQSFRMACFLCFNILAGALGGLLAAGIAHMHGTLGLQGWQWIFILESIPTLLLAVLTWVILTPSPSTASFLTTDERIYASNRILMECDVLPTASVSWRQTRKALTNYRIYLLCLCNMLLHVPSSGVVMFFPSLIKDMGFGATQAQLLTVPPYLLAAIISLIVPFWSDRTRVRGLFIIFIPFLALFGFIVLAVAPWTWVRYAGVTIVLTGIVPISGVLVAWLTNNCVGHTERATALAMLISTGSLASMAGTQVYRADDRPRYQRGHTIMACSIALAIMAAAVVRASFVHANRRLDKKQQMDHLNSKTKTTKETGSQNPQFRYIL